MHMMSTINWLSVLVAALSSFAIGGLWYGPLFQKPWMAATGITKEQGRKSNPALVFGGAFVLNLLIATGLALLMGEHRGVGSGLHTGAFTALFFVATGLGVIYLFEMRPFRHWLINAGYQVVAFAVMGAIIGAWPG
jgi:hypothetical protein